MEILDLQTMAYRDAWAVQEKLQEEVLAGGEERVVFVEHPPVITFGRRAEEAAKHLVASEKLLGEMGVEVVHSDRGGDITFHGPGQLVAYPIVRINDHKLSVGGYVRRLQEIVMLGLGDLGVAGKCDGPIGVWADDGGASPAKICAIGVRIRRGVSMHGMALNVTTDLRYFDLIVPCGLSDRRATSMQKIQGDRTPAMAEVKKVFAARFAEAFQGGWIVR